MPIVQLVVVTITVLVQTYTYGIYNSFGSMPIGISIYFSIDNDKVVITCFRFIKDFSKMKIQSPK
jgi:hypothetical protein